MKRILLVLTLVMALVAVMVPAAVGAAPAYSTPFTVSITYQNVGLGAADVSISYYSENSGTPAVVFPAGSLAAGASTSKLVGEAVTSGSFKGSAVLSSNEPVIATIVQIDGSGAVRNRPLSNGFSAGDGASKQLVATVLKNTFGSTTYFSVQNTETVPANLTVQFFAVGSTTPAFTATHNGLPANAAKYFDAGTIAQLPNGFNGSAVVTAKKADGTAANIVVTVDELDVAGVGAKSFEGASQYGNEVYMPSALCNAFGGQTTAYAVQNADLASSVTFNVIYKQAGKGDVTDGPYTIPAGGKKSITGCTKLPQGGNGSAIIRRQSGANNALVAVGKVVGANITSAFLGIVAGNGSNKVALPYVRWANANIANNQQRASIAIQNIGSTAATNVRVEYIDRNGVLKGTHSLGTIAAGAKLSSNPAAGNALDSCGNFGMYGPCNGPTSFGGGAYVKSDSGQLAVIVRILTGSPTVAAGEDYNGINVQ
jgi:hypothetical protein